MASELRIHTRSGQESVRLGRLLGRLAARGDVIALVGPLGAGKTTLARGIAAGLGVGDRVTSPSFTLIHEHSGRLPFYHIDLYRLSPGQAQDLGLEDYLGGEGVAAVEWAERLPAEVGDEALEIEITFADEDTTRSLRLRARGPRGRALLERLQPALRAEAGAAPN